MKGLNGIDGIDDILALTPLQQGMLFHTLYAPESSVYNLQIEFALEGDLDEGALEQAWRTAVERHTVLRTSFVWERVEKPYQVVHHHAHLKIARHDWRALNAAEQDERRRSCLEENRTSLFDLTKSPLMRLALIVLSEHKFRLVWTFHHIILEGWSAVIILSEVWKCYGDLCAHRSPDLPAVRPYAEFIRWLQQKDQSIAEAYWRERLKGFGAPTRLAIDRSIGSAPAEVKRVDSCSFTLSKNFADALKGLARTHRVTLNTVVQGAWSILLSRYSGEQDVVFGAVLSGRPPDLAGVESIVGLFVNTLPARVNVDGDVTLIPWLQALQLDQATMRQYEYSSLMQVQAWRDVAGGQPLFHTALAFQNWLGDFPSGQMTPDLQVTELETQETSDQPLTLQVMMGDTLTLNLVYDVERFDRAAVERILTHCRILLEAMAAHPQARLKDLPLLTDPERHQLLVEWNETNTDYPADMLLHESFEAQAARTPDAVAVEYEGRQLTYGELNTQANQVAHYLARYGVGPEVMVGICVERSLDMVVGILGILKAGAAYVPLDPDYPVPRLTFMLDDTAAPLLLTQMRLRDRLSGYRGRTVSLDADWPEIAGERQDDPKVRVSARSLAYVIYTSGSTGKPKGVAVSHRAVNRLVMNTDYVQVTSADVMAQASNVSFDAATFEIWGALLNGARLVLVPKDMLLSPQAMSTAIGRHGITTLFLTTALFNQMVEQIPAALGKLHHLLFGGEAVDPQRVRELLDKGPPKRLLHVYGPTETTTFASWHLAESVAQSATSVPIGRPIANTKLYILDSRLNPVPVGVAGELYIGGDGLARGYLNRPELTAEKFINNPFSDEIESRLYRTGDLARYLTDGNIEFLGRIDNQIKIRGYRIEPGEISAVLNTYPSIRDSHVLARRQKSGELSLCAYYIADHTAGNIPTDSELRSFLRERLPNYMVPGSLIRVETIPLTPNGKVDPQGLPDPESDATETGRECVEPRDEMERVLCRIWAETLKLERVGIDDDFFTIGGHSLLAAKLFSRLDEQFGRSLPLSVLFSAPTVRALAERYRTAPQQQFRSLVALRKSGSLTPVFAVPGVYGNVLGFAELCRELGPEQPFYGLQSLGLDGSTAPLTSIEEIAKLNISELLAVQPQGPYAIIGACFGATVAYEMARQLLAEGVDIAYLGLLDPTQREGRDLCDSPASTPRTLRRAAALSNLVSGRLHLYLEEMNQLNGKDRINFVAQKLRFLGASVKQSKRLGGVRRELNQIDVYRSNLYGLDHYQRKPLNGNLKFLEIFETARCSGAAPNESIDWAAFWKDSVTRHLVPGKDSGDMLSETNVGVVAALLKQRLQLALSRKPIETLGNVVIHLSGMAVS